MEMLTDLHLGWHTSVVVKFVPSQPVTCLLATFIHFLETSLLHCQVPAASQAGLETSLTLVSLGHRIIKGLQSYIIYNIGKQRPTGEEGFVQGNPPL